MQSEEENCSLEAEWKIREGGRNCFEIHHIPCGNDAFYRYKKCRTCGKTVPEDLITQAMLLDPIWTSYE